MMTRQHQNPSLGFTGHDPQKKPLPTLSKSKLLAFRQCPRRLWLEVRNPSARADSPATQASFRTGHRVGELAQRKYDPTGSGHLIDLATLGMREAMNQSQHWLTHATTPVFEMGFQAAGARAFADVMLPVQDAQGGQAWRMVEVKSSASVKNHHQEDIAIQAYVARQAGVPLQSVALAHIDSSWTYPGNTDYNGLLTEVDLTDVASDLGAEVHEWISAAAHICASNVEPSRPTGPHCNSPFACGFHAHCSKGETQYSHPISWLPRLAAEKQNLWKAQGIHEMGQVPDEHLNAVQQRVKHCTLNGSIYFDAEGAAHDLAPHTLPGYFLDFETIAFAVPIWAGTKPFRQIPFQFSLHTISALGEVAHSGEFLDLSGNDPSQLFAQALVNTCGASGPVFVYNAGFETARINELAERFADLAPALLAINARVVDLLPIARNRYYHPDQQGSWSIKKVLPTLAQLDYSQLDGVKDGGLAQEAYLRAIDPACGEEDKAQIRRQLLAYCKLDTLAMVAIWEKFSGLAVHMQQDK